MCRWWWLGLLAGCQAVEQQDGWGEEPLLPSADGSQVPSPPQALELEVTALWPGQSTTWRVSGLAAGESVHIARAAGVGSDTCLGVAGGLCLDLQSPPTLLGIATANAQGVATLTRNLPSSLPLGIDAAFQAVALRGAGGVDSVKSNAVLRIVRPNGQTATPFGDRPPNPSCVAFDRPPTQASLQLDPVFTGVSLSLPVAMVQIPGDDSTWFAAELSGRIRRFANDPATTLVSTALDIRSRVVSGNELGMLALAFHPNFANNGYLYVYYTGGSSGSPVSRLSRFTSTDGGLSFSPASEVILMSVVQPASNHNGGNVVFGPDGLLYWSLGDGGSANDPWNNAQNTSNVLGAMLRIDVDGGTPYAIPADNPFAGGGGAPEIFAWGLRNPYRFTFDRGTGDLWAGDVGQDAREEIDIIELGGNYGWRVMEGNRCANGPGCFGPQFIAPVYEYTHTGGSKSVIGGYVYRGSEMLDLDGTYVYADFYDGDVLGLWLDPLTGTWTSSLLATRPGLQISSFAEDLAGELYVIDYAGDIYRLADAGPGGTALPQWLSQTGCFDPADPTVPVEAMIPYEPRQELWSDGLEKERWLALPDGEGIAVGSDGDWDLPIGTVLAKQFSHLGAPVETRLFVRHDDGDWGAYTYVWDEAVGDAELVRSGADLDLGGLVWHVPRQSECFACHTAAAGRSLGLETAQLNHAIDFGPAVVNQLAHLADIGMLPPLDPVTSAAFPSLEDAAVAVTPRARAYLHANCSMCHRPGGGGLGGLDLRWTTGLASTGTCDVVPSNGTLGIVGARVVAPGEPERSVLWERLRIVGDGRMPPLGTVLEHEAATDVIAEWITGLTSCP
jgi:uncharacterized repeat protein (TIGR03806 family)